MCSKGASSSHYKPLFVRRNVFSTSSSVSYARPVILPDRIVIIYRTFMTNAVYNRIRKVSRSRAEIPSGGDTTFSLASSLVLLFCCPAHFLRMQSAQEQPVCPGSPVVASIAQIFAGRCLCSCRRLDSTGGGVSGCEAMRLGRDSSSLTFSKTNADGWRPLSP